MVQAIEYLTGFALNLPLETFRDIILNFKEVDYYTYDSLCHQISLEYPRIVFHPQAVGDQDALDLLQEYKDNHGAGLGGGSGETRALMDPHSAWQNYMGE